ncbi:MAG: ATP-binding cassette domain-containing protein [Bacilli bacterium]|nr:ATP-binding cassette domain-containing protein [Bacilli bacterium]MCH4228463.1 ATP-binding cassette domain-containing protein [Bacilli bacterium]MCH4277603.1 ATP-binding cassette domain-containing protein [Bacilli bacterium]MCI2054942.1 ATP-binding cassette domain-containing protein [Bacilli bacterium]
MDANNTIISLVGVSKVFDGSFVAVDNFNLEIKKGEFVTLLGPSGCGKTTTLRMIAGFELPSKGKIFLGGQDITNLPPYQRPVNTVFQHYALFPNLDVYDNIAFGLKIKKIPYEAKDRHGNTVTKYKRMDAKSIDEKVAKALAIVDLEEMEDRDISNLSGGQQQRVAIARAIVNEPQVLLLDEPLSALDHKMRQDMQLELKEMHNKLGITFIYVTHDQEEALSMSDTIVVMKDGAIQQVGTPESIYNEPVSAYVADFIGESNIYNGTMVGPKQVRFIGGIWNCIDDFPLNEKVDVVIRPEDVELGTPGKGVVDGIISSRIFKGEDYSYVINVGKNEVLCRDTHLKEVGEKVSIHVVKENLQIMHKDLTNNVWDDAYIDKNGNVVIGEDAFPVDLTQLVKGSSVDDDGYVVDPKNKKKFDFRDAKVVAKCTLEDPVISDNLDQGHATGTIVSTVWLGDHYQYIVRTDDEEDFIVNTPYAWNEGDMVSVDIPVAALKLRLKKDLDAYGAD